MTNLNKAPIDKPYMKESIFLQHEIPKLRRNYKTRPGCDCNYKKKRKKKTVQIPQVRSREGKKYHTLSLPLWHREEVSDSREKKDIKIGR